MNNLVRIAPRFRRRPPVAPPHRICKRFLALNSPFFKVSSEVQDALASSNPVVALESTIYTHGWPYPDNLALARHLEGVVRANGAVPATIGVLDGVAHIGLDSVQLDELVGKPGARKISRRDLAFVAGARSNGNRIHGGTTISGTMVLAHLAGIKIFGTGGLGGVHRGVETSMDISADLTELGKTPVAVVASGCKGFLDIPRTLEYLETQGVPVMTFAEGRKGAIDFPAFWSRDSGVPTPMTVQNEEEAASIINAQFSLRVDSGLFFASPVPPEHSIPMEELAAMIQKSVEQSIVAGATGASNTPFILNRIKELSQGRSVTANRALVESNVARAAKIATALSNLEKTSAQGAPHSVSQSTILPAAEFAQTRVQEETIVTPPFSRPIDLMVAGALAVDLSCDEIPLGSPLGGARFPVMGTSNPCNISQTCGGVAYNVARAAHCMGSSVKLFATIADDLPGRSALESMTAQGMDIGGVQILGHDSGVKTAQYISVNDSERNLVIGLSDMSILDSSSREFDTLWKEQIKKHNPNWLVLDANWSSSAISHWFAEAKQANVRTAFEPVSTAKSTRLFHSQQAFGDLGSKRSGNLQAFPFHSLDLATPNLQELSAMYTAARETGHFDQEDWWKVVDSFNIPSTGARKELVDATSAELVDAGIPQQSIQLLPFIPCLLTKLGPRGVLLTMLLSKDDERLHSARAAPYILSVSSSNSRDVGGVYLRHFPPAEVVPRDELVSVNGVGDTFLGVLMAAVARSDSAKVEDFINLAQKASVLTLKSKESVSPDISRLHRA